MQDFLFSRRRRRLFSYTWSAVREVATRAVNDLDWIFQIMYFSTILAFDHLRHRIHIIGISSATKVQSLEPLPDALQR